MRLYILVLMKERGTQKKQIEDTHMAHHNNVLQ